ncbi:hypothetical protein HMPREF0971_03115 [Segatella oris F0302]|uniref:Lipoprotein n=1 Tax=Segatella oris F0302 TaxID=649760 RepID=D1QVS5_9BACT|nr:hypothetical protein HMPREF0971_03115 [Segatella oris F0302]
MVLFFHKQQIIFSHECFSLAICIISSCHLRHIAVCFASFYLAI